MRSGVLRRKRTWKLRSKSETDGHLWYNRNMSTHTTLLDAKLFIKGASADDLTELIDSLNARRLVLDGQAQFTYPRGSKVKFNSGRRGWVYGVVEEWKRGGKAVVRPDTGGLKWTVGGSHLEPQ